MRRQLYKTWSTCKHYVTFSKSSLKFLVMLSMRNEPQHLANALLFWSKSDLKSGHGAFSCKQSKIPVGHTKFLFWLTTWTCVCAPLHKLHISRQKKPGYLILNTSNSCMWNSSQDYGSSSLYPEHVSIWEHFALSTRHEAEANRSHKQQPETWL